MPYFPKLEKEFEKLSLWLDMRHEQDSKEASVVRRAALAGVRRWIRKLEVATSGAASGLTLSWSESSAPDFSAYLAYRSDEPGADTSTVLLATLSRRDERQLAVTGLTENTSYYFRIYVRDRSGFLSASNEIEARTANLPPAPTVLDTPAVFTDTEVELHWSAAADHDFREYRLYRDTTAAVTEASLRIRTVNDRAIVTHTDGGLRENTRYYYRAYVADTGDSVAASQVVSVTTVNVAPSPVSLATPDSAEITPESVHVSWSSSSAHDFARYRLFRGSVPGVSTASDSVFSTDLRDLAFCDDVGLSDSTAYYYRVFVEDRGGLLTGSNEVRVLTPPAGP